MRENRSFGSGLPWENETQALVAVGVEGLAIERFRERASRVDSAIASSHLQILLGREIEGGASLERLLSNQPIQKGPDPSPSPYMCLPT